MAYYAEKSDMLLQTLIRKLLPYKRILLYLFFGGLTTVINIAAYFLLAKILHVEFLTSNGLAWILSVLFAYVTNKRYVFESRGRGFSHICRELGAFVGSRLFSGLLDMFIMFLFIEIVAMNDMVVKIMANVVVVVVNYVLSKHWVFKEEVRSVE
jgi:putative flippase GtrA